MDQFRVTFLIVGTQKGGTTALGYFLSSHPEICFAPSKEVHLFDAAHFDDAWERAEINRRYRACFPNYRGQRIVGEATPIYMYLPRVAQRIHQYNPAMKLVFLLRDPVDRAVSHFHMERARNAEWLPMELAFRLERYRLWRDRGNTSEASALRRHSYTDRGFYSKQIANMLRFFPREQMLFVGSEELASRHAETLRRVYAFLGVTHRGFMPAAADLFGGSYERGIKPRMNKWLRRCFEREIDELRRVFPDITRSWRD